MIALQKKVTKEDMDSVKMVAEMRERGTCIATIHAQYQAEERRKRFIKIKNNKLNINNCKKVNYE